MINVRGIQKNKMKKIKQQDLFNKSVKEEWKKEWKDMPEYKQKDLRSFRRLIFHFRNQKDIDKFSKIINQKIHPKTNSYWHPKLKPRIASDKRWVDEGEINES